MKYFALLFALACGSVVLHADAKSDWAKSMKGRAATLKIDLPTLIPKNIGALVLSEERGTFYAVSYLSDRSLEQLLAKIKVEKGKGKGVRVWGWETGTIEPIEFISVKAGAPVTIESVVIKGPTVTVYLWDEFVTHTKKTLTRFPELPSTSFTIELPAKVSKDFGEREVVERHIATVLTFGK
jgi:hypothetical protein